MNPDNFDFSSDVDLSGHEAMIEEGVCPRCGGDCDRDSVDVGVGVLHGPWGCMCGWSEDPEYDSKFKGGYQDPGGYLDPMGNFWPEDNIVVQMMRAAEKVAEEGE